MDDNSVLVFGSDDSEDGSAWSMIADESVA